MTVENKSSMLPWKRTERVLEKPEVSLKGSVYEFVDKRMSRSVWYPIYAYAGEKMLPGIHNIMLDRPFDVFNHVSNMTLGAAIASTAAFFYARKMSVHEDQKGIQISEKSMRRFRRYGIPAVCFAAALANSVTETKWGVKVLPTHKLSEGLTSVPDVLDTVYSTVWAGATSWFIWRKVKK